MGTAKRAFPADFVHKLKLAQKELKESRVWLLFVSRLSPGPRVEALRTESGELLLMIGWGRRAREVTRTTVWGGVRVRSRALRGEGRHVDID